VTGEGSGRGQGPGHLRAALEAIYRAESRRVLATLIRLLGDFDRAEEALHEAFAAAAAAWPSQGLPQNPRAWLVSTGRFKGIDALRRRSRLAAVPAGALPGAAEAPREPTDGAEHLPDDDLRLIFTCCHPALSPDAQVALTLREVCGLATEEIARAFLVGAPTVAQRIVRAKAKIRDAAIPYEVPPPSELPERLGIVLHVVYLLFNEGYSPTRGEGVVRADLAAEAIRLARLLVELLPGDPEAQGLLALMLLHDARRAARAGPDGELVLLAEQDRSRWDRLQIGEGVALVEGALASGRAGAFAVQAAIAAVHAQAARAEETDWAEIVGLYDALLRLSPTPVVALNRAVAVAMCDGPAAGLQLVDELLAGEGLRDYHLAQAARADLLRRLGRREEAAVAYREALALARLEPERRFLARRLAEVGDPSASRPAPGGSPGSG
jgi:RNA polymerase sigma-70 factor (ECF subfamily)